MSDKLKPCPFCGSEDIETHEWDFPPAAPENEIEQLSVFCNNCHVKTPDFSYSSGKAEELWNTRCITKDPYEVVINHTDPTEQETALCLKYRQRARGAEAASKIDSECNVIMQKALGSISCQKISEYDSCQPVAAGSLAMASKALEDCKAITDKFMEDVLMPDKGGD